MTKHGPLKIGATYDDLVAVPENLVAEMFDGELYATPRPAFPHAHAASVLGIEIGGPFARGRNGPGGWWIIDEPELHFGADVLVPDIAGWRRTRLPTLPQVAHLSLAPDWICEVLSPSTETIDRVKKLRIYARESVAHAWLVNPCCVRWKSWPSSRSVGPWSHPTKTTRRFARSRSTRSSSSLVRSGFDRRPARRRRSGSVG